MKDKHQIKNIIFDFGGVIINIDFLLTVEAFHHLGVLNFEELCTGLVQDHFFDDMEKGLISPASFRNRIRDVSNVMLSDEQVDHAWNSTLLDLPEKNIRFIESLKGRYRLFLLSNTNEIHERAFSRMIREQFGENVLEKVFDKVYLSHHLQMRKPDAEIFYHVMQENNLDAMETLFVDDSFQHIEGAKKTGLQTFYFEKGKRLDDILSSLK
ncbi:MAG: HAD family phosphatase [Bacteroidetes bacterium]|nr:HAD family phosphatase [Bacteroidota bacterium]